MEIFVIVSGVLLAGSSAADPPEGLYIAPGVAYVGCFAHGQAHHEEVLEVLISPHCTQAHPESCLTPPTCIESCQNTNTSYVYIGLKYPGLCFCDSLLRGVDQTNFVDGIHCDGRCIVDSQLACGAGYNMLVYQFSSVPPSTTDVGTGTTNSEGYSTKGDVITTSDSWKTDKIPQRNTAIIAGAAAGGAAVLIVAGSVVGVCIWRKKSGQTDKPSSSLALQDVNSHTSHPPSDPCTNPTVSPNPSNIDALYAKPDKKRKHKMSSPDDPSYQDVFPTGAQSQYATVNDDYTPNTMVQQDSAPYDSIKNDPQYAVVKKGPRYRPNVDVNPIYMGGSDEGEASLNQEHTDMLDMVDNTIYE